jgi:ADP-heptose:LPS heptosyltransferase
MIISSKPWKSKHPPKRILAIRLQAMGDLVITLPYLQQLRNTLPRDTIIDLLTREEVMDIPQNMELFNRVYAIKGGRNFKLQLLYTFTLLPKLLWNRYDTVIDLQNNLLSRIARKSIHPKAWTEFDRYSPNAAGARNANTIAALQLGTGMAANNFKLKSNEGIDALLLANGYKQNNQLVVLNPAGAFENRNWPLDYYAVFSKLWLQKYPDTQFLILGIDKIAYKAAFLKQQLDTHIIDLVNKTTPAQAFALMQQVTFILSEDSGLMHMAWVSGVPTLAMFGSTRSDWSRPLGTYTGFVDSSDMACGNCMLEICRLKNDAFNLCMTRLLPEFIFKKALTLLDQTKAYQPSK